MHNPKLTFFLLVALVTLLTVHSIPPVDQAQAQTSCPTTPTSTNSVSIPFSVPETNTYTVWTRIIAPDTTNNSLWLQVDNGCAVNVGDNASLTPGQLTWVNYQDGNIANVVALNITAGNHTLKVTEREGGVGIDTFLVTTNTTCVPTGLGNNCPIPTNTPTATPIPTLAPTATKAPTPIPTSTPTPTPIPVPATPTSTAASIFGYNTKGPVLDYGDIGNVVCGKFTTSKTGKLISMSVYVNTIDTSPSNQYQLGIYADNGLATSSPTTLIGKSASAVLKANSWNTVSVTGNVTANSRYWLCYQSNGRTKALNNMSLTNGTTNAMVYKGGGFGTWPTSFGTVSGRANLLYSIYATVQ